MLKQISCAAIALTAVTSTTTIEAVAFPGFLPNSVLAATQVEKRRPLIANIPTPVAERSPMVVRIGSRAHLFDGYFYCELPRTPLPIGSEASGQRSTTQTLSFLAR
ncbi:hypothetical protein [Cohaesibacter gelatinilyticus]|uniref:Uncharacterized protein n=1 Tax=Cohaesibacter gelatinilyticus TaxID=372072 RepID=A0A285NDA8_9HYPH|nr:hypothetical protein [Cohaesibacter gelatinilyticus]SNZ07278.1 hypothetical protein SAMN06265368_0795 [Cohaesibacter gelatinilyticus]HAT85615.1 hypothetical protein [Hyphomicrobiales bacterium]